jgi:hypothetical protein
MGNQVHTILPVVEKFTCFLEVRESNLEYIFASIENFEHNSFYDIRMSEMIILEHSDKW